MWFKLYEDLYNFQIKILSNSLDGPTAEMRPKSIEIGVKHKTNKQMLMFHWLVSINLVSVDRYLQITKQKKQLHYADIFLLFRKLHIFLRTYSRYKYCSCHAILSAIRQYGKCLIHIRLPLYYDKSNLFN